MSTLSFDDEADLLFAGLPAQHDTLEFGVIGFDDQFTVTLYNQAESRLVGLRVEQALGRHLFEQVAPCMNTALVGQKFRDDGPLDLQLDYVFSLKAAPRKVRLRLLARPGQALRYVLVRTR